MAEMELALKQADNTDTYIEEPVGEIRISVRRLVEFVLRSGSIDNRHQGGSADAMQEGSRIHRMIQKKMGPEYMAEVALKHAIPMKGYVLVIDGRADGIEQKKDIVMVDEIKGTYRDLDHLRKPVPVHVAQAKCYAYIYALQHKLPAMQIRMTYCNLDSEDIRYFYDEFSFSELESFFSVLIADYKRWSDFTWEWRKLRMDSLEKLVFPFDYRKGQKDLVSYVYQTIYHKRKLFIEAPTGVGKTISTIFPALKALSRNMGEKIFYLTAKTITRTVADECFELLREQNLRFKSIILTAKEKTCFLSQVECNPEKCPYANGHYDRINDALYDLLMSEDRFNRENIECYAKKHKVCPFEMALDMSLFSDGIICDYNYLFDPHVYLKRFFEGTGGDYLFLIDEAHNLLDRGREMYSAELIKEEFLSLKSEIQHTINEELAHSKNISSGGEEENAFAIEDNQITLEMAGLVEAKAPVKKKKRQRSAGKAKSVFVRGGYAERLKYQLEKCNKELLLLKRECEGDRVIESIEDFVNPLQRLYACMSDYLEEQEEENLPVRELILDFYFKVAHFLCIYELLDENYVIYSTFGENDEFILRLFNLNPRENLKKCMMKGRSSILFSATLLPLHYYKELLGGDEEDYEVYAKSVFDPEKRALFISSDVTTKYTRRSPEEFYNIARYIDRIISGRPGNYMVFFPSYAFMKSIYEVYSERFARENVECILQQEVMSETQREEFLNRFNIGGELPNIEDRILMEIDVDEDMETLVGFCVLGGIFGEGIDLKHDSLIGSIIVGTGLPQVGFEKELLKNYFDRRGENGFDYAYRYPGMNKVLQAAGRVIRTQEDIGLIALLDERFMQLSYRKLFPREWDNAEVVDVDRLERRIERFWDSWGKL